MIGRQVFLVREKAPLLFCIVMKRMTCMIKIFYVTDRYIFDYHPMDTRNTIMIPNKLKPKIMLRKIDWSLVRHLLVHERKED
jgi:hypothetical protein